ncbi:unnamed protein product [Cylicocyclus nassatus]|uniref:Neurotransmitter-gated ion-channel ligand-binding domain-containing protein n=1 Tax=Cylicocyclus nassatus TaxID=53992 RepID=A0AA36H463_CYLNA|nr:unnamed protein product [Cylicocyclus nassatus]
MINTTILPYEAIWLPDTYIYNSVVMNREETERYINVVVTTNFWKGERGAEIKFMYPALYRTSCMLDIRYFPYDQQECKLTISSWTSSKSDIDYTAEYDGVNLDNFILNEEWVVVSFNIRRIEEKFVCCPEPWVLLEAILVVRRKPLYYIVNLIIPTSVITMVAVTGFFTAASTSSERSSEEAALMRSETARSNWKRLAKKASEKRKKEDMNGNGDARPSPQQQNSFQKEVEPPPLMHCISALSATDNNLLDSKLKRRYALEWEYLATVLDRLLLIVFALVVFLVTFLMIMVGEAMHLSYQLTSEPSLSITP